MTVSPGTSTSPPPGCAPRVYGYLRGYWRWICCLPLAVIASYQRRDAAVITRPIVDVALTVACSVIAIVTIGKRIMFVGFLWSASTHHIREIRAIPLEEFVSAKVAWAPYFDVCGNIALFIPFGFLVFLRGHDAQPWGQVAGPGGGAGGWRRSYGLRCIAVGCAVSIAIEITQYVAAVGFTDIDDVVTNTCGTAVGVWLARQSGDRGRAAMIVAVFGGGIACAIMTVASVAVVR